MKTLTPKSKSAPDVLRDCTAQSLLGMSNKQLKQIDPLIMNLLVAKEIPSLANLQILPYVQKMDKWEHDIRRGLAATKSQFSEAPHQWKHDINFFNLGYVCFYLDREIGIRYREDQKDNLPISYTNPSDLFATGVMDSGEGTCANMSLLHVALAWRMHWPASLACVWSHFICRYDDGRVTYNIEATKTGGGGFHSHPDEYYLETHNLPPEAIRSGSDLRALTPKQMLGCFIGHRGRHYSDIGEVDSAESDYLLARSLFPNNRYLHFSQVMSSIQQGAVLFHPQESGHPRELSDWLQKLVRAEPWTLRQFKKEKTDASPSKSEYVYDRSGEQK